MYDPYPYALRSCPTYHISITRRRITADRGHRLQLKVATGCNWYWIIGLLINFTNLDSIKALVYSAVINGIVAVPILIAVMKIANDKKIPLGNVYSIEIENS
jgi:hypothetical protein